MRGASPANEFSLGLGDAKTKRIAKALVRGVRLSVYLPTYICQIITDDKYIYTRM